MISPKAHPPEDAVLRVSNLGTCRFPSPVPTHHERFVHEDDRVLLFAGTAELEPYLRSGETPPAFEPAGPRERIFFDPSKLACGIVTCGGLCPGLNNVVRSIVLRLRYAYGVDRVFGFRYGYAGLVGNSGHAPIRLTPEVVEALHEQGGTRLGSSRGPQDVGAMVDTLQSLGIGILFVLGGDGGLRGASAIAAEIASRDLAISVIGVPKTIDNDLQWTQRSFGFATAVEAAREVLRAAHTEARAAWNGVGLVKLMGRHSGFIAAHATLASSDVNFCLVPEVPFALDGENGFLRCLERRLDDKHHAVVVVAEGAGQDHFSHDREPGRDASGNVKLDDIGLLLRDRIARHFSARGKDVATRYFDPSYIIRSQPANAVDAQYCLVLGQHAVHAGLAGRTDMLVGAWSGRFTHVPIPLAIASRHCLDPRGDDWQRVLESTGQPASMID